MGATTSRLFLALWPGPIAREGILRWQAAHRWPSHARVTAAQDLHITLHFIGAVPLARLPDVSAALDVPSRRFELDLDCTHLWPRGIAVLSPSKFPQALVDLHSDLAGALQRAALPVDARAYRPHVTLARHAESTVPPTEPPAPVRWRAQGYVLAESQGGRYRVLRRYPAL